eukprot:COSAG02_NODE_48335_length_334_cov_0.936170_1_plen_55_part_10
MVLIDPSLQNTLLEVKHCGRGRPLDTRAQMLGAAVWGRGGGSCSARASSRQGSLN